MRYINNKHLQRLCDLTELEGLNAQIKQVAEQNRGAFIDDHAAACSSIKEALWALGSGKCWYSEAQLQQQEGHVEHFRPRKRLHGAGHSGYWWKAFDWTNFRLAHATVNMRVTDYLTGKKAGKGSYFPLIDEAARAIDKEHEDGEHPLLLDPVFSADCKLLCFDSSNGKPIPRYTKEEDEVRHERAMASIDYYHLDEGTWNKDRKDLMDDIATLCDKILEAAKKGAEGRAEYDGLVSELLRYLDSFSEFTSAAYQIAREKGILELLYPIPA